MPDTPTTTDLNARLAEHVEKRFSDPREIEDLSNHFRREGYVKLPGLVGPDIFNEISDEVHRLLDLHERRIDITLKETSDSRRSMSTVSQAAIAKSSTLVPELYGSAALTDLLGKIANEPVLPCPWEDERYIAIRQHKPGDTHGWHWGDFSFTVIWIIEAPSSEYGGQLQTVPHTAWNKSDPRVHHWLETNPVKTWPHATGDVYFLRSDTTLHRTIPLNAERTRIILNTCWGSTLDQDKPATHETMSAMFD